jgi:transcriptional regulator GlxA family with amidase domain
MERVSELPAWILSHLHENLTVEGLAARACLCPRHFSRVFKEVFNCTPGHFVEELRLDEARRRLLGVRTTISRVAESVGFKSADAFRRAFERQVGVTPTAFRRRTGKSSLWGIGPNSRSQQQPETYSAAA